jgi:cytidine deaminase
MSLHEGAIARLKKHAIRAAGYAYSPYSKFRVGAAVVSEAGTVYGGSNVENASFGLTQCAERSALTAAISDGAAPGSLETLLIYTPGTIAHPPCGACRQVMHELMSEDSLVISCCDGDDSRSWTRSEYLPDPFVENALLR